MATVKTEQDRDYTVKTVDKAFELLEILAESEEGFTLAQLASRAEMTRNGAFRILRTMYDKGMVEQGPHPGTYRLGLCAATFAQKLMKNMSLINYAHPVLEELARRHDEAVYLTVVKDNGVLFLDMVDSRQQIKAAPLLGRLFPFFTNAAGKVIKSFDSRDLIRRVFKRKSALELEQLDRELSEIRAKGVAVDSGGLGEGIISVAVAVKDYTGKVIGAITLIGPSFRMVAGRIEEEIIPSLLEEAEILSGKFGYAPA